tara:strand:- start:10684 stop:10845 length:162 start_codon:yes stop_codon:yes gene_type:complete
MTDNAEKHQKSNLMRSLEEILSELDNQQLFLPALRIVEALDILSGKRDDKFFG